MTDLFFFGFFGLLLMFGLRRPFIWVLAYLWIDILAPQKIAFGFFASLQVSLIAFCAAFAGWALFDNKRNISISLRQVLLAFLLLWCWFTLQDSPFPEPAGTKWEWVWKALFFAIFLPFTLTTYKRIEAAALFMVLSVGAIIISGAIKTVFGGGGYGVLALFVNNNSGIYESSTLATVAVGIIPLILWFTKHGTIFKPDWRVKLFAYALIVACILIPFGTVARTGLVCLAVLLVLSLRDVKRRLLFLGAGAMVGVMALPFVPQSYYDRMATIGSHEGDQSASTRVAVWQWTWEYVQDNPLGGGFDIYRANRFEYEMPVVTESGNTTVTQYREVVDEARAFHSAYFEVLGEQGWPGFIAWMWLQGLGLLQMEVIRRRWRRKTGPGDQWQAPLATSLQYAQIIYLVGSLFQGIAYQPFILLLIGLQIALWSYLKRVEEAQVEAARPKVVRRRPAGEVGTLGEAQA